MSRRSAALPSGVPPAIVAEASAGERDLALLPTGAGVAALVVAAEEQDDDAAEGMTIRASRRSACWGDARRSRLAESSERELIG